MDIQYVGHSSFRLRGKEGIVITDPFESSVGFSLPQLRADIVTISHDHADHNNASGIKPTTGRENPYVINQAGEYEVSGISVYGYHTWHDESQGEERGDNIMYSIFLEDVHILHLGDLGHKLDEGALDKIPDVDVLLCPVGGVYTITAEQAVEIIGKLDPTYVIPMHYKTELHNQEMFGEMGTVEDFIKAVGKTPKEMDKLTITSAKSTGTGDDTETEVVILSAKIE